MQYTAAVITISRKDARGEQTDTIGPFLASMLEEAGYQVAHTASIPNDQELIRQELIRCADEKKLSLVLTVGGPVFSPWDITPESTQATMKRAAAEISETMCAENMRISSKGCLSWEVAGAQSQTLIVNLPGGEAVSREHLSAVLKAIGHCLDTLCSKGTADYCAVSESCEAPPSIDAWLREAKALENAGKIGMYLFHNGVVRKTARSQVREGNTQAKPVSGMCFSYDAKKVAEAVEETRRLPGIYHVRVWLNHGELQVGDDLMRVLVGGDIRPHVIAALEALVTTLKTRCVTEEELQEL